MSDAAYRQAQRTIKRTIIAAYSSRPTDLDLSGNRLTALPREIALLTALKSLDLSGNRLTVLPPEIAQLTALQSLDLSGNQLTALPPEIARLTALQSLDLSGNQLTALPPEIVQLTALQSLYLGYNQLTALPPEIARLTALESLDLSGNQLTALPPEIAQLTALQSLDLSGNQLTALPPELGQLSSLEDAAEADDEPYGGGVLIDENPLSAPYPRLVAAGQPAATLNVLAWLRGDLNPEDLPKLPETSAEETPGSEPPSLPSQGVGPHFAVDEGGVIGFAPPEALDRQGNNVARLRTLHPILRDLSQNLVEAIASGDAPHAYLRDRAAAYKKIVDQALDAIDFSLLHVEGVRLANADKATAEKIAERHSNLPPLETAAREILDTLLQLHGIFIMSTTEGIEVIAAEERYRRTPEEERKYRAAEIDFARSLQNKPDIIDSSAASVVLGAVEQIGQGSNLERSGVVGTGALRNVVITLAVGAIVAAPVLGGLALGMGGAISGGLAGRLASEILTRSKAFASVILPNTNRLDRLSETESKYIAERVARGLGRQMRFVLTSEDRLRRLAGDREQFSWIHKALDWIKVQADENKE